jgi:hypothetical protein
MSACSKSLGNACPGLFSCQAPRLEFQIVDHKDGGGDAVDYYCLSAFTPYQMSLLCQFLDSVKKLSPGVSMAASIDVFLSFGVCSAACASFARDTTER